MLTMELLTYDGERAHLPVLLEWDLLYTGSVPCDSVSATLPLQRRHGPGAAQGHPFPGHGGTGTVRLAGWWTPMRSSWTAGGCW